MLFIACSGDSGLVAEPRTLSGWHPQRTFSYLGPRASLAPVAPRRHRHYTGLTRSRPHYLSTPPLPPKVLPGKWHRLARPAGGIPLAIHPEAGEHARQVDARRRQPPRVSRVVQCACSPSRPCLPCRQRATEKIPGVNPEIHGRALTSAEAAGPNGCVLLIKSDPQLAAPLASLGGPLAAAFNGLSASLPPPPEDNALPPGVFLDPHVPASPQAWRCEPAVAALADLFQQRDYGSPFVTRAFPHSELVLDVEKRACGGRKVRHPSRSQPSLHCVCAAHSFCLPYRTHSVWRSLGPRTLANPRSSA